MKLLKNALNLEVDEGPVLGGAATAWEHVKSRLKVFAIAYTVLMPANPEPARPFWPGHFITTPIVTKGHSSK